MQKLKRPGLITRLGQAFAISLFIALLLYAEKKPDEIDIIPVKDNGGYTLYIENHADYPLQVMVTVILNNMAADVDFPYIATVGAHSKINAFSLQPQDRSKDSGYRFQYKWRKVDFESKTCVEDVFCIVTELVDDVMKFYVVSHQPLPVALLFQPKVFRNLDTRVQFPLVRNCPGGKRTALFAAKLIDKWDGWDQTFVYKWQYGIIGARPQRDFSYRLPFKRGTSHIMIQGFNGEFSHRGKFALDFEMPEGTPICAARAGTVISVEQKYNGGGELDVLKQKANHIEILHDDGTIGRYAHLKKNGVRVRVGQWVNKGKVIGYSGNTGYSSGPHLHFEVVVLTETLDYKSIPVAFRTKSRRLVLLHEGVSYTAW